MSTTWWTAALLALGVTVPRAHAEIPPVALRSLQQAQYRLASSATRTALTENPDDPDLHALMGVIWSRAGYPLDAIGALEFGEGGAFYETAGARAMADALRDVGRPQEALPLRYGALFTQGTSEGLEVTTWLQIAQDHRAAGDYDLAFDALSQAVALQPRSEIVHAVAAELAMDLGDLDEADVELDLAARTGPANATVNCALARRALFDDDVVAALAYAENALAARSRLRRARALALEAKRRMGDPVAAIHAMRQMRHSFTEDPLLLSVYARALADVGDLAEAAAVAERLAVVYPTDRDVALTVAYVDDASRAR